MLRKIIAIFLITLIIGIYIPKTAQAAIATPTVLIDDSQSTVTTHTTASFDPAGNALLIACVTNLENPTDTIDSMSGFSLTWTQHGQLAQGPVRVSIFSAQTTSDPAAGTVAAVHGGEVNHSHVTVLQIASGFDTGTPVVQYAEANGVDAAMDVTLSALESGGITVSCVASRDDDDGITPGDNDTELSDINIGGGSTNLRMQVQHGTDNTPGWSAMQTTANAGAAIEIDEEVTSTRRVFIIGFNYLREIQNAQVDTFV